MRRRKTIVAAILVALLGIAIFALWPSRPQEPVELLSCLKPPAPRFAWIEDWVPRYWRWYWKLRSRFRGPTITIETCVVRVKSHGSNSSGALQIDPQKELGLGQPFLTDTNGVIAWPLNAEQLADLQSRLKRAQVKHRDDLKLQVARMSTRSSMGAMMTMGKSIAVNGAIGDVGVTLMVYPILKGNNLDLWAGMTSTELVTNAQALRTNVNLSLRSQLTNQCGLFVVPTNATGDVYGVLFSGSWPQAK